MSQDAAFIDPSDVVRQKNGRIDLFNTILSLKDSNSQIPVLDRSTVSSQNPLTTASLPISKSESSNDNGHPYPASAPHTTTTPSNIAGGSRKRHQSPSTIEGDGSHSAKLSRTAASSGSTAHAGGGGGRPFERVFIGYCARPETIPAGIAYWHDEQHVILKDAYPKAKVHMLVLPRQRIDKVTDLSGAGGIRFVEQLVERATWLVERLKKEWPMLEFKMGFHAIPSILQLHLHIISQEFCADALKKKQHWNSFTTPFFLNPQFVIDNIQTKGSFSLTAQQTEDFRAMISRDLKCNQCNERPKNMPALKRHLQEHFDRTVKQRQEQDAVVL
ncbi:hypothetical protein KVV02_006917 [Mortierella alpina]|uniref:HIT domain-containing protein n=1 Tax=Mortierella alpina TaxID=64518 RepID=A0A9P8A337_MORAP|nr:hypothetical protein KVV02_006917 [Mortierella alpina]